MGNVQMLLRQHVGAPCAAVVKAGDEVKKGTKIAEPTGLGANIFSSVYGKVTEVTEDRISLQRNSRTNSCRSMCRRERASLIW